MIIIKTKTGDIFVNDREMVNVTHNREVHTVDINDGKVVGTLWHNPPIEHVESVVLECNDAMVIVGLPKYPIMASGIVAVLMIIT